MKRVFTSQDRSAITIVRGLLADEGIETVVQNENMSAVSGEVPFMLAMPELWVRDEDEAQALEVVGRFEPGKPPDQEPREAWKCPQCGEMIEGQFTACWNCGAPRE